jgi:RHS repeat-associated protein
VINSFDAAGLVASSVDALGETNFATMDVLGRPASTLVYGSSGSLVREKYFAYSADHHSVTVTDGSGANAIRHTTWTDDDGRAVVSIAYPASGETEFTLNRYDVVGNLVSSQYNSSGGGAIANWTTTSLAYDGLNRAIQKVDRDNALTTYAYDPLNDLTNRAMPGSNLIYAASYSPAGQILNERNLSGGSFARSNNYSYFASGTPFAGLLQTRTDGRGVSCLYAYDSWLRATNFAYTGPLAEQDLTTTLQYEPRGYITNVTEQFTGTNTAPAASVQRSYDVYGQLTSDAANNGSFAYSDTQTWDAAGRRAQLNFGAAKYGFGWQADGSLISANDSTDGGVHTGVGVYSYNTAGLLTSRSVGNRSTSITSRDGEGRPLSVNTSVNMAPELNETNVWSGDGLLVSHSLWRGDYFGMDNRAYAYANASRRLTQEQLNVNASTTWTNTFAYDNGTVSGPGVLTSAGQSGASIPQWSGLAGSFSRIVASTNTMIGYAAYGHTVGLVTLSALLDNQPVPVTATSTDTNSMQWRAPLQLTPGTHQLTVAAQVLNGLYTTSATNTFTNTAAYQAATDSYDAAGNITNRVWLNPTNGVDRTQTLSWDARNRLHAVTERDASNSGYNWTATYDGLNRRISTTSILVTNGVALTAQPTSINSYYDPQVEFLELGVNYGSTTEFKLYGPDLNGVYGGLNGVGGLDAVSPILNLFQPTVSDERGNILAVITNGAMCWNPARPTGYGSVPGYQPLPLANGANIALASAWRGRWADITGFYNVGLRPYDPVSGRWLTFDSVWNEIDASGMTFCGGDPVNRMDADGRLSANNYSQNPTMGLGNDNGTQNLYFGIAQQVQTYLQTTVCFQNDTSATTGSPGQPPLVYDESQVGGRTYSSVTMPTGQYGFYVSPTPLPADYGLTTTTPITTWDVQAQAEMGALTGTAIVLGTMLTDTEDAAPDLLAARQSIAQQFYEDAGWSADRIANHLQSIDFSQPVDVVTIPQGTQVVQYQIPGSAVGNYFAPVGTPANSLGIYTSGRVGSIFTATEDTTVLRSTAADVNNTWEMPGWNIQAPGHGTQYFTPTPTSFAPSP